MADEPHEAFIWEALEYIGATTANAECPFCKNKTWAYAKRDDGIPRAALLEYTKGQDTVKIPSLPLTCEKCGFVRLHDLAMVKTKLDEPHG